jgi:hypothetical protein
VIVMHPLGMIGIGFILVLVGVLLPFLMVLQILQSTFLLNFLAYGSSIAGLFLGFLGASAYIRNRR